VTWNGTLNQNVLQVSPTASTDYSVVSVGANGCTSSAEITIVVHYAEDTSIFISSYGPLIMSGQTFTQSGVYTLDLNSIHGCDSVVTLNLNVFFNGIEENLKDQIRITNPVQNGQLIIYSDDAEKIEILGINDLLGREIEYRIEESNNSKTILTFSLPSGMYMISVRKDNILINKPFVVSAP